MLNKSGTLSNKMRDWYVHPLPQVRDTLRGDTGRYVTQGYSLCMQGLYAKWEQAFSKRLRLAGRIWKAIRGVQMMLTAKQSEEILKELFSRVGQTYSQSTVSAENWYLLHTWTMAEQDDFKLWLTRYLMKKLRMRKEFCERKAAWFILCYGWKFSAT